VVDHPHGYVHDQQRKLLLSNESVRVASGSVTRQSLQTGDNEYL